MATITSDHFQVTSSSPSGATIATDYVSGSSGAHFQVIKINTGGDGADALLSNSNPLPISYTTTSGMSYVPVSGNTAGTLPIQVQITGGASLDVVGMTVDGGTIDTITNGVSTDIRSVVGGITIGVATVGVETVTISGYVGLSAGTNNIGDVDVLTVAIPSSVTGSTLMATDSATALPTRNFTSGIRLTNFSSDTATYVGDSAVSTTNGYPLNPLDSLFLEVSTSSGVFAVCATGTTADLRFIGS